MVIGLPITALSLDDVWFDDIRAQMEEGRAASNGLLMGRKRAAHDDMGISHLGPGWQLLALVLLAAVLFAVWWGASWFFHAVSLIWVVAIDCVFAGICIGYFIAQWEMKRKAARSAKEPE